MLQVLFFVLEDSWRALQCQAGKYRKYVQLPLKYQNDDAIRPGNLGEREKKSNSLRVPTGGKCYRKTIIVMMQYLLFMQL